jgi:hypothetical protein
MDRRPVAHLQVGGDLPYAVVGHRRQYEDSEAEIVAVYGPVPSRRDAEELASALSEMGLDHALAVVPAYVVRPVMVTELPVELDI